jgi:hypothetical protein
MSNARTSTPTTRRIDWRFLLPAPLSSTFDKVVLLGADSDVVDAFIATGLARVVTTKPGERDADLVAVCWPAMARPTDVVAATREGGLIYVEVDRRRSDSRRTTPRRLAAELSAAGATVTAQYALRPAPDRCELYVPLDRCGALTWFLSSEYIATSPLKCAAESMLRWTCGADSSRAGVVAPFHATIAVAGPTPVPPSPDRPARSMAMIVHGGQRVVQIEFSERSPGSPQFVTKVPTLASSGQRTHQEHIMVTRIREALGAPDNDTLPNPRELLHSTAGPIMVEDGAPGRSLAHLCGRWGRLSREKVEDLRLATSWLIGLHREHAIRQGLWDDERFAESVDRPLAEFTSRFDTTDEELELFGAVRGVAADLIGRPLPVVWEHGDFTIWNVFREGDRIQVLDWEYSRIGVPLVDIIRMATHWHEAVRRLQAPSARWKGFADLFTGPAEHAATKEALAAVSRYEAALEIDPRFRSVFLIMSRVELAVRRFEHLVESGIIDDDVRARNAALGYLSALVDRRADLFCLRP